LLGSEAVASMSDDAKEDGNIKTAEALDERRRFHAS
jgi:hypothetical protein